MSKIHVMDEVLANKIAAGEVVEKCMNVVKELVENSIDANSDEITIKLVDSGKNLAIKFMFISGLFISCSKVIVAVGT